jgi:hypothetical protein
MTREWPELTLLERQVLALVVEGRTNSFIRRRLGIGGRFNGAPLPPSTPKPGFTLLASLTPRPKCDSAWRSGAGTTLHVKGGNNAQLAVLGGSNALRIVGLGCCSYPSCGRKMRKPPDGLALSVATIGSRHFRGLGLPGLPGGIGVRGVLWPIHLGSPDGIIR